MIADSRRRQRTASDIPSAASRSLLASITPSQIHRWTHTPKCADKTRL